MSEDEFIQAIRLHICSIIPPPSQFDISHLTGQERLTQEVDIEFRTARAIGYFAIGGQGKTSICKLMVNYYASAYAGRCALIEFPTNDCNEKEVVIQCNKALQQLTNNSNIHHIDDFDQCLQQMMEQMEKLKVFIAIDNVCNSCLHFVQRILDTAKSSRGSKILVTSRSQQVLLNLLKDASCVMPLPGVNEEEAQQIFVKSFNRYAGLGVPLADANVHDVIEWVRINCGGYHPLTINSVGVSLGRTEGHINWHAAWKLKRQLDFTGSGSTTDIAIKINFDSIPKARRDMFLDVALIYLPLLGREFRTLDDLFLPCLELLMSAIYDGEMDKHEINMTLTQLACDGLLEIEDHKFYEQFEDIRVYVHDLYRGLAAREAAVSPCFILVNKDNLPGINWAEAERIVSWPSDVEEISMPDYELVVPKLRVLIIGKTGNVRGPIHMPQLRVLSLRHMDEYNMDLSDMPKLLWLELGFKIFSRFEGWKWLLKDISCLTNLSVLVLVGSEDEEEKMNEDGNIMNEDEGLNLNEDEGLNLCLDGLVNLQILTIQGLRSLQKISGLGSLINLKYCKLTLLPQLWKVDNFNSSLTQLQFLSILTYRLRGDGWTALPNLRYLILTYTSTAGACIDIHGMLDLEAFTLHLDSPMQSTGNVVNVHGLPKLAVLVLQGRHVEEISFRALPNLRILAFVMSGLKQLAFSKFEGLTNLHYLAVSRSMSLKEIDWSSLNDLTNLTNLEISECYELEQIRGEPKGMNQTLRSLKIWKCPRLKKLSGLDFLTNCDFQFDTTDLYVASISILEAM